jgi:hypothetical protein
VRRFTMGIDPLCGDEGSAHQLGLSSTRSSTLTHCHVGLHLVERSTIKLCSTVSCCCPIIALSCSGRPTTLTTTATNAGEDTDGQKKPSLQEATKSRAPSVELAKRRLCPAGTKNTPPVATSMPPLVVALPVMLRITCTHDTGHRANGQLSVIVQEWRTRNDKMDDSRADLVAWPTAITCGPGEPGSCVLVDGGNSQRCSLKSSARP